MNNQLQLLKNNLNTKVIRTVKDLIAATVPDGATLTNGGYDLFSEEIKKYLVKKTGELILWEDWYKMPHPDISPTEDAEFEYINPVEKLMREYPIQDDTWPSRRWKEDMSDFVDLSG